MRAEQKSLRQLAKELGVSHSYLSQIKNGKRPASDKVVSIFSKSGKQKPGAEGGGRTHTNFKVQRILSPSRLPIPPPRHNLYPTWNVTEC